MPCYLFTFHAYRSWMPDHKRGFTRRKEGIVPKDEKLATAYEREAKEEPVTFFEDLQLVLIDELLNNADKQSIRLHYVATDATHVHVLVSWKEFRPWEKVRLSIKSSLTRCLNRKLKPRTWFAENASRKRVKDQRHFDYLVATYLPKHGGWKRSEAKGLHK